MIAGTRRHELEHALASVLSHAHNRVEILEYAYHDPADFSRDMSMTVRYRVPRFARPVAGGLEFSSPLMGVVLNDGNLFRAGTANWSEKRETDVFLYYTQLLEGKEDIRLPRGYRAADLPSSNEIDETYAYFKGESRTNGRNLAITSRAEIRRRQIPPDGYGGFKRAMDEAKAWGAKVYRVEKGGRS
jgi:hypothetical protein